LTINAITLFVLAVSSYSYSQTDSSLISTKALLVYDTIDSKTKIYIDTYRKTAADAGIALKEISLKHATIADLSEFDCLLIYSEVMAFNMMFPVKKWLKTVKGIENRRFFILTTAAKFLDENNLNELTGIVNKNKGIIVDARSSATGKLTEAQKIDLVRKHLGKLK
jgi:hypothetical protein